MPEEGLGSPTRGLRCRTRVTASDGPREPRRERADDQRADAADAQPLRCAWRLSQQVRSSWRTSLASARDPRRRHPHDRARSAGGLPGRCRGPPALVAARRDQRAGCEHGSHSGGRSQSCRRGWPDSREPDRGREPRTRGALVRLGRGVLHMTEDLLATLRRPGAGSSEGCRARVPPLTPPTGRWSRGTVVEGERAERTYTYTVGPCGMVSPPNGRHAPTRAGCCHEAS